MRRDPFQAIADPTRRNIIQLLSKGSLNLNAVAGEFDISRPAISKHIRILNECGLVIIKQTGRERVCTANLAGLAEVSDWLEKYKMFWTSKLHSLGSFLKKEKRVDIIKKQNRTKQNKSTKAKRK